MEGRRLDRIWVFVRLTRPIFLLGGVLAFSLGAAAAYRQGYALDLGRLLAGQSMVTAIQLLAQYANEYFDVRADSLVGASRTWFSGGSGVLPCGLLSRRAAGRAMRACAVLAALAIVLSAARPPAMLLGAAAFFGAWFYSAPPVRLVGSGWGELAASLVVALLTPATGYALQAGRVDGVLLAICLPLVLVHMAMLVAFEFPDREADSAAGKRTLTVRVGRARAAWLHAGLLAGGVGVMLAYAASGWPAARLLWLAAPLGAWQVVAAWHSEAAWNRFTLGAVGLFVLAAGLWVLGILVQ